jgi:hypothetical protein
MRNRPEPSWTRAAGTLHQVQEEVQRGHALDASAASGQASSPSASAGSTPEECGSQDLPAREYVRAVLDLYLWLPGTSAVASRYDRRCAAQLHRRGVPLDVVRSAMVVAVARRTFRRGDPLPRVRALHFFLPVVEEMLETPCEPGYVKYLEHHLRSLAAAKAQPNSPRS